MTPPTAETPTPDAAAVPAAPAPKPGDTAQPPDFQPPAPAPRDGALKSRSWPRLLLGWLLAGRSSAWLSSALLHVFIILALSLLFLRRDLGTGPVLITGSIEANIPADLEIDLDGGGASGDQPMAPGEVAAEALATSHASSPTVAPPRLREPAAASTRAGSVWPNFSTSGSVVGGGLEGRSVGRRRGLALAGGGTDQSEKAVERGLAWLAEHQLEDGSWRFDLTSCPACAGACRDSGFFDSTTASTGLALLCFLGAGYTHHEGPYQTEVGQGIYYLTESMSVTSSGGDLRDKGFGVDRNGRLVTIVEQVRGRGDNMYSHGIAALALTEAFAMTNDPELRQAAQLAVNFIVNGQYDDGGWRYAPASENPGPGDTTVSGWQVMALKSGELGGLEIPYETWLRFDAFLDSMQTRGGSEYVYLRGQRSTRATTAIGLLCRMYRHWPRDHRPLVRGVNALGKQQPESNHMYYNYYASQVLHHYGGVPFKRWNHKVRDYLVATQAKVGHETGSWYFDEAHSSHGGRLYTTAMAIMTLEVYYRYMPLYRELK